MPRIKTTPSTLPQYSDAFLRDVCRTPRTESSYRNALINLQAFAESTKITSNANPLLSQSISAELLAEYYSWLRKHGYRNASIRLYLVAVQQYLMWLEAGKHLANRLQVSEIKAILERKTGRRNQRIRPERRGSDPAMGALLAHYENEIANLSSEDARYEQRRLIGLRNHALLHTLYATAGRAAEVASLQRADVAEGKATHVEIVGKGGRKRTLILTSHAQASIRAYLQLRTDSATGLFISHGAYKEQPITTQSIWQIVNDAAKAIFGTDRQGRPLKRVGPHSFRHLRAQDLSDEGMPITSLQAMLGHASIETTRSTYAPKTPVDKLTEEIATYGRNPSDVIKRGHQRKREDE